MTKARSAAKVWHIAQLSSILLAVGACNSSGRHGGTEPAPGSTAAGATPLTFTMSRVGLPEEGSWKCDPVFADVNGDGHLDLGAHIRLGDGPAVWLGDGTGRWTPSSEGLAYGDKHSCGGGLRFGDVNHDDLLDLVVADHCAGIFVYLGDGTGRWEMVTREMWPRDRVPEGNEPREYSGIESVALGDINSDGHIDLVVGASDSGGITIYLGDGSGRDWEQSPTNLGPDRWVNRVQLADINGDGALDLAGSCGAGPRVWFGDGQGGWRAVSDGFPTPTIGGLFHGLRLADVNSDGRLDLLVSNWIDGPEVYLLRDDETWEKQPDVFPKMQGGSCGLAVGDVDRDGHLDIVCSGRLPYDVGYVYGVYWLRGDGQGGWTYVEGCGLPDVGLSFTWGVGLADVNGDGALDIALGCGGIVATSRQYAKPTIQAGMLLWCTQTPDK